MIRPLETGDAGAVAALHQAALHTRMAGMAGRHLLACYYRALVAGVGGCGFVALEPDGRVAGFICGVWDPAAVRKNLLRMTWGRLLSWGGVHVFCHPASLADIFRRLLPCRAQRCRLGGEAEYELRPIVVAEEYRGRGIAEHLLRQLLEDVRNRGYKSVMLKTEIDNVRANAFYVKHGFALERTAAGYNQYRRFLES